MEKNKTADILNQPMVKTASGLLLDHTTAGIEGISNINDKIRSATIDQVYSAHKEKLDKAMNAPIPDVKIPYNFVLTRAAPPAMIGKTKAGLILNKLDVDDRTLTRMKIMTENVSDKQEVMMMGFNVDPRVCSVGDTVMIDFRRFRTLNDDHIAGVIETSYEVPLFNIDGEDYLLIDSRDIIYAKEKK